MKCIITGHTNGIGKAIYDHFQSKGWEVKGMSRSNGYNIVTDQERIIEDATDSDIFVNCAYDGNGQLNLLNSLYDKVKNMIVVGSVGADWSSIWKGYGDNKLALQNRCKELSSQNGIANIFYLKPAFCENANWPIYVDPKYVASFTEILKIVDIWIEVPKIFSVEFTLKKTIAMDEHINEKNKHD